MDEEILGKYYRLWRLIRGLQFKDVPKEIENKAKASLALWARELGVKAPITVIKPEFLPEVEKALDESFKKGFLPSIPPIPPELNNLVEAHQEHLTEKIEEELKAAGELTIEEQVEKAHQHKWEGVEKTGEKDFFQKEKTETATLYNYADPVESEIPENELIQERVYHVLRRHNLLDNAGQPKVSAWKQLSEAKKIELQKELGPLLHFNELAARYSAHARWALDETPNLLLYPERHRRLAIKVGRDCAQRINNQFYKTYNETLKRTGDKNAAQNAAQKSAEDLTYRFFEKAAGIEDAVEKIFKPLNLSAEERTKLIGQVKESMFRYGSRHLNPAIPINRRSLQYLVPNLPKAVFLDVDENNLPRMRVYPAGHPQLETTYWPTPTEEGIVNQTAQALKGPFGAEAIYLKNQIEYFSANPIGGTINLTVLDPLRGIIETVVPGAKWAHLKYIDFTFEKGEILRKIYVTPELNYRFWNAIKRHVGGRLGLYKEAFYAPGRSRPVLSPLAWLGQSSSAPFRRGANYFFGRSKKSKSLFMKRFWFGLSQAFRRRETDWDRSPLVLLIKLAVDLTLGTVGRLIQRAAVGRFAKLFTRLTETGFGKRFLGRPAIRAFRATAGIGKTWARSLFSLNTLSGGFLGYAIGAPLGVPQLGMYLGGASGWHYEFYLNIGKSERLMAWVQKPGANILSRGFRAVVRIPARFFATHPYVRVPFKGLAFGYVLYLMGFPSWIVPLMGGAHWAWSTKGWWGPKLLAGIEKIPGVGRILGRLIGFLSRFRLLGLLGRLLSWAFPAITTAPLILDLLSGTPPLIALQHWFSGPFYLGQLTMIEVAWLAKGLWWPALKTGLLAAINFIIPDAVAFWLYETIPAIVAAIASASALTLVGIGLLVVVSGFTLYLLTSAFFVERAISARVVSPYLPIEKTVTPVKDQNGEIIALDYSLTYTYEPPPGVAGLLDNIRVLDRFELSGPDSIPGIFDMTAWTINPSSPGCEYMLNTNPVFPRSFGWSQKRSLESPAKICPWLGPLNPGESRTITLHLPLKNPPLSNYLKGDAMLCDTLLVTGQIQGGESLSSSSPPICINAEGETWIFGWPTCYHGCSSNYGYRPDPVQSPGPGRRCEFHEGIDLPPSPQEGCTDIHPASRGTIVRQGQHPGYGCYVIIQHRESLYTLYAHLEDEFRCNFPKNEGDEVAPSDIIGIMDDSGRSTSIHLHFGVSSCGTISCFLDNPQNPCDFLPSCPGGCLYRTRHACEGIIR